MKSDLEEKQEKRKENCANLRTAQQRILALRHALVFTFTFLTLDCCQFAWKQNAIQFFIVSPCILIH